MGYVTGGGVIDMGCHSWGCYPVSRFHECRHQEYVNLNPVLMILYNNFVIFVTIHVLLAIVNKMHCLLINLSNKLYTHGNGNTFPSR